MTLHSTTKLKTFSIFPYIFGKWISTHTASKVCCMLCELFETGWQINITLSTEKTNKTTKAPQSLTPISFGKGYQSQVNLWRIELFSVCSVNWHINNTFALQGTVLLELDSVIKNSHETKHRSATCTNASKSVDAHSLHLKTCQNHMNISLQKSRVFKLFCSLICVVVVPAWLYW